MQNKAKTYAQVMVNVLDGVSEAEAKKRVRRLKILLQKRGDFKMVSKILQEFSLAWKQRKGKMGEVQSAEHLSEQTQKEFKNLLKEKGYLAEERVDPRLIGGVAIFLGNELLIDGTIRGKLQRLAKLLEK